MTAATATGPPPVSARRPSRPPVRRPWPVRLILAPFGAASWRATAHIVLDLFVGLVAWAVALPLIVGGACAAAFGVGLPLLWAGVSLVRILARAERARVTAFLGVQIGAPTRPPRRPSGSRTGAVLAALRRDVTDGNVWRALVYLLLRLPIGALGTAVVVASWSWGLVMAPLPLYSRALPDSDLLPSGGWWTVLWCVSGIAALLHAPWTARAVAGLDVALAAGLLGRSRAARLESRVQTLADTRSGVVDAADAERRRIERDLHDGAQQRLVALAMNLGRARARLEAEPQLAGGPAPDEAAQLVAEAHEEAKQALVELRNLARGIHPAVLTDRGLDAALSAIAARSPVPVRVDARLPGRLAPTVEAVAYFVVSEALANVAKHSAALAAEVRVRAVQGRLVVTVHDDGTGGAAERAGGGLAGLRGRVAAVDGRLSLSSPPGGPTTLTMDVPCEP